MEVTFLEFFRFLAQFFELTHFFILAASIFLKTVSSCWTVQVCPQKVLDFPSHAFPDRWRSHFWSFFRFLAQFFELTHFFILAASIFLKTVSSCRTVQVCTQKVLDFPSHAFPDRWRSHFWSFFRFLAQFFELT